MKSHPISTVLAVWLLAIAAGDSTAQETQPNEPPPFNVLDTLNGLGGDFGAAGGQELTLSGSYQIAKGGRQGKLSVTAQMAPLWHVYSITQKGVPGPSKITVGASPDFEVVGPFSPDTPPKSREIEVFDNIVEEHYGQVTWTAPVRLAEGTDPEKVTFDVLFNGQVCHDEGGCIPIENRPVPIEFAGYCEPEAATGEFRTNRAHAVIRGHVEPRAVEPGGAVKLVLTAVPEEPWHVYAYAKTDPMKVSKPTLIAVTSPADWTAGEAVASHEPIEEEFGIEEEPVIYYHEEPVTWMVELRVPTNASPGQYEVSGSLGFQTCTKSKCDLPTAAEFRATVAVADTASEGQAPLAFSQGRYRQVATVVAERFGPPDDQTASPKLDLSNLQGSESGAAEMPMALVLLTAFAAGFILNFMPCVLPVIGLKVMSFVQQAGENRTRVFMLNLWYCLGLMLVFMVLASLAVFVGLSWGAQLSSVTFTVVLTAIVFVFALSFLGVWEIPIPGFVGSGKMSGAAEQEGPTGAFSKGVLATILATPCSGPMLGPALTWAVSQPPLVTYTAFACVGLGMAAPYLLIGAFPQLVSFLPKPGAWMETFKQIMGFVLLGTVVFLLSFIPIAFVIPTVSFLIGLWAAFWWVGRVPLTKPFDVRLRAWLGGTAFAILIGLISFTWLHGVMESRFQRAVDLELSRRNVEAPRAVAAREDDENELPWQPYSPELLEKLTSAQTTVLVDFTADW